MNGNAKDGGVIKCRVAIVGAGASALYCAHLVASQEDSGILVLEARDRIGGRILSTKERCKNVNGDEVEFTVDHGAAWVHGTGYEWGSNPDQQEAIPCENPMMPLMQQAAEGQESLYQQHLNPISKRGNPWVRPKHVMHDANDVVLYLAGAQLDPDDAIIEQALERHTFLLNCVSNVGNEMFKNGNGMDTISTSLSETLESVKRKYPLNDESDANRIEALAKWYLHIIEAWNGGQASELQLSEFTNDTTIMNDSQYTEEGDFYGPHCTLRHGMEQVLEPLLNDGGAERVMCGQEVISIRNDVESDAVIISTASGLTVEAECCVVTLPVGCLQEAIRKDNFFHPALSETKQEAIMALRMGKYKKVFMSFDRIFWPIHESMIGMVRLEQKDELGTELLLHNLWARDGIPCLEAVLIGSAAAWATNKPDEEIYQAVLHFMSDAMGLDYHTLNEWFVKETSHVTRWEEDEYSRGAYSFFTLGTRDSHPEALRESEWNGKLVFCGEATIAEFEGSVHAALFSAENAAKSVQKCINS